MLRLVAAISVIALSGCAQQIYAEHCASYGYPQGAPGFGDCMRQEQAIDLARGQQLTNALIGAAAVYSLTAPQPVYYASPSINCSQMGVFWHCQ